MFYHWLCWQALAGAESGCGGDLDMASFYLRLCLYKLSKNKKVFSIDEPLLFICNELQVCSKKHHEIHKIQIQMQEGN